jgi:hypothetical protein
MKMYRNVFLVSLGLFLAGMFLLLAYQGDGAVAQDDMTPTLDAPPPGTRYSFTTDFSKHNVPYDEIISGGPPKDGIPAIDDPKFVSVEEADGWIGNREPVIFLEMNGDARAYPLQILTWHEIVNDEVGGVPVTITFCPLCNTALAFDRRFDDRVLDFGTTGRLRFSNLIMYDRQTETWWQQASGEAIAGEYTGERLEFLPAPIIAWQTFKEEHPEGLTLSRETGHARSYGRNPYGGYDNVDTSPFLYDGPVIDGQLLPKERVLAVEIEGAQPAAYPYLVLESVRVVNDEIGDEPVTVFWERGTASALDTAEIAAGRDVGAANAFSRRLGDDVLTFRYEDGAILDDQTDSEWNILGEAVAGVLEGERLTPLVAQNHLWFSWSVFRPETRVYFPDDWTFED